MELNSKLAFCVDLFLRFRSAGNLYILQIHMKISRFKLLQLLMKVIVIEWPGFELVGFIPVLMSSTSLT